MESDIDDFMGNIAVIIKRQRVEIASARLRMAVLLATSRHQADEIASLRTELTETRAKFDDYLLDYKAVHEIGAMRDLRAELADVKEQLHYANGTCDLAMKHRNTAEAAIRQDAEQIARLKEALAFVVTFKITDSDGQEVCEDILHEARKIARAALVRRPQSLSQSKADVCDACGGTWIFDDRDVARRPDCCTGTFSCLACRSQGERSET